MKTKKTEVLTELVIIEDDELKLAIAKELEIPDPKEPSESQDECSK